MAQIIKYEEIKKKEELLKVKIKKSKGSILRKADAFRI